MSIVPPVTGIWTADDVIFAPVRANRGDACELARDLLAAADAPGRPRAARSAGAAAAV